MIRKAVPRSSIIDCLSEVRLGANLQLFLEPNGFRVKGSTGEGKLLWIYDIYNEFI